MTSPLTMGASRSLVATAVLAWLVGANPAQAQYSDWESAEDTPRERPEGTSSAEPERGAGTGEREGSEATEEEEGEEEGPSLEEEMGDTDAGGSLVGWAELGLFAGNYEHAGVFDVDALSLSPLFGVSYAFTDRLRASLTAGLALAFYSSYLDPGGAAMDGGVGFSLANPLLGADWSGGSADSLRYRLGLGVTLPLATGDSGGEAFAVALAAASRGAWNLWLWAPDFVALVATGRMEADLGERIVVGADGGFGAMFFVGEGSGETSLVLQGAGDLEWRTSDTFVLGMRVMAVYASEDALPEREEVQVSLMPYGRITSGDTFFTAGFVFNITPPFGVSFKDGNPWGVRIGAGTVLL